MNEPLNFKWLIEFGDERQDPKVIVEFYERIQIIPGTKKIIFLNTQIRSWEEKRYTNALVGNWIPDEDDD